MERRRLRGLEYLSALPGGLLKAAWRNRLKRLCAAQKAKAPLRGAKGKRLCPEL